MGKIRCCLLRDLPAYKKHKDFWWDIFTFIIKIFFRKMGPHVENCSLYIKLTVVTQLLPPGTFLTCIHYDAPSFNSIRWIVQNYKKITSSTYLYILFYFLIYLLFYRLCYYFVEKCSCVKSKLICLRSNHPTEWKRFKQTGPRPDKDFPN